jgi:two-component system sensor histidine kinase UhpB
MEEVKEQERDHLGKELHDNINQILASTKLFLEVAESNEAMREEMIRLSKESVMDAIKEIRALSRTLVGAREEFDLVSSLKELVRGYRLANTSKIHFICRGYIEELPDDIKLTMFRIVQEGLSNTFKYSGATEIHLEISFRDRAIISLRDNGRGFDLNDRSGGIGISNIRHRVQFYNGNIDINTAPGKGFSMMIEIPVSEPAA